MTSTTSSQLGDLLTRFQHIGDASWFEDLYRTAAGTYVLVVDDLASTMTETEALAWLLAHGRDDIHLDMWCMTNNLVPAG